jgi:ribonuclease-3
MDSLEDQLEYRFKNPLLLAEALTHASKRHETHQSITDNQRLEFLGDAVLELIYTTELFHRFSHFQEGLLTKLRIRLVSKTALASLATKLRLGDHLQMGKGEIASGGRLRASNLANGFEALIGAIYLDGGIEAATRVVLRFSHSEIEEIHEHPEEKNPKGQLQELLQTLSPNSPTYELIDTEGMDHARIFTVHVIWETHILGKGSGSSKKAAEIMAAERALANPALKELLPAIDHPPGTSMAISCEQAANYSESNDSTGSCSPPNT